MIFFLTGIIGATGLVCILSRKTFLGLLIGFQLLILGATMIFVLAGISSGIPVQGHLIGLFITFGGVAQLVAGYSLAIRLYYLRTNLNINELRSLKQ